MNPPLCYDGDQIIAEYSDISALIAKFVYGTGIDEIVAMKKGSSSYYYHYDGLGSVINLTDQSGTIAESYSYDVYGQPSSASSIGNRYQFTGREYDAETGLYHYRARSYNPKIGRFLQTDPVGYHNSCNLYHYCFNNPLNYFDPFGEDVFYINNKFNKGEATFLPVSHSFVAITEINPATGQPQVVRTYSWVNTNGGKWEETNNEQNKVGAQLAVDIGKGAWKKGDKTLDPYVDALFQERKSEKGGFWPGPRGTCKDQAKKLIRDAIIQRNLQAATGG